MCSKIEAKNILNLEYSGRIELILLVPTCELCQTICYYMNPISSALVILGSVWADRHDDAVQMLSIASQRQSYVGRRSKDPLTGHHNGAASLAVHISPHILRPR